MEINTNNNKNLTNLYSFLNNYRISDKNIKPTHTSMGNVFIGSFNIPDNKIDEFYKLYKKVIKVNIIPNLLEVHLDYGPIIIDLDFKYTLKTSDNITRIYTYDDIKIVLELYNKIICNFLSINDDNFKIYLLEKSKPKLISVNDSENTIQYKDGVHIIYPEICVNNKIQLLFRELILNKIIDDKLLNHLTLDNKMDDVFDKAVIERNNWLLYGSGKDSNIHNLYKIKKIYNFDLDEIEEEDDDIDDLVRYLSIRKFKSDEHANYNNDYNLEKLSNLYNEIISKKTNNKPYTLNSDIIKAKKLISLLNSNRASNYSTWIEVGFCLHNIDDTLLEEWIEFSKKSPSNYKEGECEKLWLKFRYEGLSIGSLYRWAKEDSPEAYSDFLLNEFDDIIKKSLDITSYSVAKVFYEFNKYQYVCVSISKKKWYEYKNHRWEYMDEAYSIINKINTELSNIYSNLCIAYHQKAMHIENNDDKKTILSKATIASKIATKLREMSFKKNVIAELCILYYDKYFMEKLDENRYLIGFSNGIYDLKNNYFRNGRPEDYISMCTNCPYINYDEKNDQIIQVLNFFEQIQPDQDMREYLLLKLSSFIEGLQRDQKFEIWTGTGANGKGRIIKLILDSFGDYATTISIALLTKPRSDANNASPSLAQTKGKRCCIFQEPENDDKIYVGNMKNLTGGDKLQARFLYCDPVEFYPQFKTILACNKLPEIPSSDGGTWRRVRVVPFEMKFVDNPIELFERKKINNLDDLMIEWKSAFMSLLIEKYQKYIKYGINEPEKVLIQTNEYQKNSDIFSEFINEKLIFLDDNSNYVIDKQMWETFKEWQRDTNRVSTKKINKGDVISELKLRLKNYKTNKFFGISIKDENDDNYITQTQTEFNKSSYNPISMSVSEKKNIKLINNDNNIDANIFDDDDIQNDVFLKK